MFCMYDFNRFGTKNFRDISGNTCLCVIDIALNETRPPRPWI